MRKLTVVFLLFSMALSAQKIEKTKNELNATSGNSRSASSSSSSNNSSGDDEDGSPFVELFFNIVGAVFKYGLIGDYNREDHLYNQVTAYPYAVGSGGNYSADSVARRQFRIDFEDQFLWSSSRLFGNHMKAKIRPFQYFYVQADYRELFERTIDNTSDRLALMHLNVCYDRIRFEKFNLGWNLGVSYVGTEVRKAGFCYGLSADYFPGKRISFSGAAKWSKINTQPVNTYEFYGRFHRKQFFATLGFQHLKIATPTYNFVTVGGGLYL
jgi:hypothetical protein